MDAAMTASATITDLPAFEIEVRLLLEAIYLRFHYDFRSYSMASVRRRVTAALTAMRCPTVSALQEKILHEPDAFAELLQYLTVQVSDLFRDPAFFRVFRECIVPELATYPSPRIWVAGSSTGEEAYTLAIVLAEEGLLERTLLYATDISPEALDKARQGVYAADRLPAFTTSHRESGGKLPLDRFYVSAYGHAAFDRRLRDRIVFSDHSLATDSVFAEVQVVTCRNVLIYFDTQLQERAVSLFQDALCRRGFLGLGSMESLLSSKLEPARARGAAAPRRARDPQGSQRRRRARALARSRRGARAARREHARHGRLRARGDDAQRRAHTTRPDHLRDRRDAGAASRVPGL
jgi:chemotaxis protein methyltransferase CheR